MAHRVGRTHPDVGCAPGYGHSAGDSFDPLRTSTALRIGRHANLVSAAIVVRVMPSLPAGALKRSRRSSYRRSRCQRAWIEVKG
jgi:hypothetical protein